MRTGLWFCCGAHVWEMTKKGACFTQGHHHLRHSCQVDTISVRWQNTHLLTVASDSQLSKWVLTKWKKLTLGCSNKCMISATGHHCNASPLRETAHATQTHGCGLQDKDLLAILNSQGLLIGKVMYLIEKSCVAKTDEHLHSQQDMGDYAHGDSLITLANSTRKKFSSWVCLVIPSEKKWNAHHV